MLTKVLTIVGNFVMEWAYRKVARLVSSFFRKKTVEKEAKESVGPLKKAETGEEISNATDDALGGM